MFVNMWMKMIICIPSSYLMNDGVGNKIAHVAFFQSAILPSTIHKHESAPDNLFDHVFNFPSIWHQSFQDFWVCN